MEDNGTLSPETALAPSETGTVSPVSNALQDKNGTPQPFPAHALKTLSGTVFPALLAQVETDTGATNLTTVSAEPETGTEPRVLSVQATPIGTERPVSPAMEVESGTPLT